MRRHGANDLDCTADIDMEIGAQMQACVKQGSRGRLHRSGHRYHRDTRRGLLATPKRRKKLRTTPLQQRTTPLPQQREAQVCTYCNDCASMMCQILSEGGSGYCVDSCTGCECEDSYESPSRRLLISDDNQEERIMQDSSEDSDSRNELHTTAWYELQTTRRCSSLLKALAENLMQDLGNDCLGAPEDLEVTVRCMEEFEKK
jgi:hypothetical protein